jgi:hypothetical protein
LYPAFADSKPGIAGFVHPSLDLRLHVCTRTGVFFARAGNELFTSTDMVLDGRQSLRALSLADLADFGEAMKQAKERYAA